MQFAGDAGAFGEPFLVLQVEAGGDLLEAALIGDPGDRAGDEGAQGEEPFGLVELRGDGDGQRGASFVPEAVAVRSDNLELVGARAEIGIDGVAGGDGSLQARSKPSRR